MTPPFLFFCKIVIFYGRVGAAYYLIKISDCNRPYGANTCIAVEVTRYALENCYEQHFVHSAGIEHSPKPIAVLKQVYPLPPSRHSPDGKGEADRETSSGRPFRGVATHLCLYAADDEENVTVFSPQSFRIIATICYTAL